MIDNLLLTLRILSNLAAIFPICAGWKNRNIVWYYCWASLLCDVTSFILKEELAMPASWLANFFMVIELTLVGYFLNKNIFRGKAALGNLVVLTVVLIFFVLNTLSKSVRHANWAAISVCNVYMIIVLLFGFRAIMRDMEYQHVLKNYFLIFCVGFFFYCCGAVLIFLFEEYLLSKNDVLLGRLWFLLNFLNIIKHSSIGYYFLLQRQSH